MLPKKGVTPKLNRVAFAAAHVVADPLADNNPWLDAAVDWDKTIAFREYLWDLGLGVAEAMDTAQRGMGLDWNGAQELIRRALAAARMRPGVKIACGVGTDHLDANARVTVDDIIRAYEEQIEAIEGMGGRLIVMASRALARAAHPARKITRAVMRASLRQVKQPVIIHWLGEMFDPALAGSGRGRPHGRRWNLPRDPAGARRQDRRHQDFAAVEGEGNLDAQPPAEGHAHVYRR